MKLTFRRRGKPTDVIDILCGPFCGVMEGQRAVGGLGLKRMRTYVEGRLRT